MSRPLALVTGGCRRLGAAISAALAGGGYDVALHSSGPASPPEPGLVERIGGAGGACWHVAADLSDEAAVEALLPEVGRLSGRLPDLLVNNAARFGQDAPASVTQAALVDHYVVNCAAPVLLTRALAATASARRPAAVVNILDQRIAAPHGDQFGYTLAKLALAEATMILAREFAPHVRVSAVAPGLTLPTADYDAPRMRRIAGMTPLQRLPGPEEVAAAVLYLAGSRSVTGQTLFVDGGAHLMRYRRDFLYLADDPA